MLYDLIERGSRTSEHAFHGRDQSRGVYLHRMENCNVYSKIPLWSPREAAAVITTAS